MGDGGGEGKHRARVGAHCQEKNSPQKCMVIYIHGKKGLATCPLPRSALTSSHRMPFKPAIYFSTADRRTSSHGFDFCEFCQELYQHATHGRDMCRMTRIHISVSRSPRGHGSVALDNEWVHSFVDFCLIPLSATYSFDVPAKNL